MMRVVVALDSFKGSLGSRPAGEAAAAGILAADPTAEVSVVAIADGGEGTIDALLGGCEGHLAPVECPDALGHPVPAAYAVLDEGRTAVLESATTIGLTAVGVIDASVPVRASSAGLGVMLRHALDCGVERILIGLGGTATTDGGTGLMAGLGTRLLDATGHPRPASTGNPLWWVEDLDPATLPDLRGVELVALTDVDNPLLGPRGAARMYGPQKGATAQQVEELERRMARWATALESATGRAVAEVPGAGAAGGLGAALLALGAHIEPGFERVAREIALRSRMDRADLVLTGEGRIDAQTGHGKCPAGVARMGREAGAVVVALAGRVDHPLGPTGDLFDAVLPIHARPLPLDEAMDVHTTAAGLTATAGEVMRLLRAGRS